MAGVGVKYNARFQQTMLRIKNPQVSIPFYTRHFNMQLVHKYDFPQMKFSLYFLERTRDGVTLPTPGTKESEKYLWSMQGTTLELTHNHGSEEDPDFSVWSGNSGSDLPKDSPLYREDVVRGFGHVAFNVEDVYEVSKRLEEGGVKFQKRPDEGRMKGLAFALDPDGYWIELVSRTKGLFQEREILSQTMMRVKDANATIAFYRDMMGMTLIRAMHVPNDFSNYFLACLSEEEKQKAPDPEEPGARDFVKTLWQPVLELTHNHGTELKDDFQVHTGNSDPARGFGHIGFLMDDLAASCSELEAAGVKFFKKPEDGTMPQIAFALDPSGYRVELIQRNSTFAGMCANF
jgi:lactoylglutathione lyase